MLSPSIYSRRDWMTGACVWKHKLCLHVYYHNTVKLKFCCIAAVQRIYCVTLISYYTTLLSCFAVLYS